MIKIGKFLTYTSCTPQCDEILSKPKNMEGEFTRKETPAKNIFHEGKLLYDIFVTDIKLHKLVARVNICNLLKVKIKS